MVSNSVVLPAPLWPIRPRISPLCSVRSTWSSARDAAEVLDQTLALEHRGWQLAARPRPVRLRRARLRVLAFGFSRLVADARGAGDEHRTQHVRSLEQVRGAAH